MERASSWPTIAARSSWNFLSSLSVLSSILSLSLQSSSAPYRFPDGRAPEPVSQFIVLAACGHHNRALTKAPAGFALSSFTLFDFLAVAWFLLGWVGYNRYSEGRGLKRGNLVGVMEMRRMDWMRQMLARDNRIVDIQIVRSLVQSASFFASTSILVVAGLVTVLGATDKAIALIHDIPLAEVATRELWEVKLLLMIVVFIYAFFKFGWAMRQLNYCSIMVGSVGPSSSLTDTDRMRAENAAKLASIASTHSNRGVRAYYFGLALLAWFIHLLALILSTVVVLLVLYRREFRSRTLGILGADGQASESTP